MKRKIKGFSLLEMAIVLFIISLLVLLMLPNIATQRKSASKISNHALQTELNTQAQLYLNDTNNKSVTIDDLRKANYLTGQQYERIKKEGLQINVEK